MISPLAIPDIPLTELHQLLRKEGCQACKLGQQRDLKGPIYFRGNQKAIWGIFGEAPGRIEDRDGTPFCGPAGRLLDAMLKTMNLTPEQQPIISNAALCRPIAPAGSGKENLRPVEIDKEALSICRPYTRHLVKKTNLKFIVLAGNTAFEAFLPNVKKKSFTETLERIYFSEEWEGIAFTSIYHPAFLLRKKNNPDTYQPYREKTVRCLNLIQQCIEDYT